jgi:hypothetical protein
VVSLAALAQPMRLRIFRALVGYLADHCCEAGEADGCTVMPRRAAPCVGT